MFKIFGKSVILIFLGLIIIVACGCTKSFNVTPSKTPQTLHYKPTSKSQFHIEFDYPGSWTIADSGNNYAPLHRLGLSDTLTPTLAPNESPHPTSIGFVTISVQPIRLTEPVNTVADELIHARGIEQRFTLLMITLLKLMVIRLELWSYRSCP